MTRERLVNARHPRAISVESAFWRPHLLFGVSKSKYIYTSATHTLPYRCPLEPRERYIHATPHQPRSAYIITDQRARLGRVGRLCKPFDACGASGEAVSIVYIQRRDVAASQRRPRGSLPRCDKALSTSYCTLPFFERNQWHACSSPLSCLREISLHDSHVRVWTATVRKRSRPGKYVHAACPANATLHAYRERPIYNVYMRYIIIQPLWYISSELIAKRRTVEEAGRGPLLIAVKLPPSLKIPWDNETIKPADPIVYTGAYTGT